MSYSLYHAQALKADFNYLIGTCLPLHDKGNTSLVKGIVIVGDDGACIYEQMQCDSLRKALLDDSYLVSKPWLFKYRVYLIHHQLDDDTTWYYQDLFETLDQLGIPITTTRRSA
jgi:hypothetical protein